MNKYNEQIKYFQFMKLIIFFNLYHIFYLIFNSNLFIQNYFYNYNLYYLLKIKIILL